MKRRLAAILSADVVGYTRLMRVDEAGTLSRLKACRRELIDPVIAKYGGRIVKLMGDGALVEFPSVVDAVQCAAEMQGALAVHNKDVPLDQQIEFRIGINLGDVIVEGDDLYGDGVNIAARLQSLAEPGGICISRPVHTQVKDKLALRFRDLGGVPVKNIQEPVHVFQILTDTAANDAGVAPRRVRSITLLAASIAVAVIFVFTATLWLYPAGPAIDNASPDRMAFALPDAPSIAVLPFTVADPEQRHLGDGISVELTNDLSGISGLFVISHDSVHAYVNETAIIRDAAQNLGVQYVLTGSVNHVGGRATIEAELTDAIIGKRLWRNRYSGSLTDARDWRRKVTNEIANTLTVEIGANGAAPAGRAGTRSAAAFDAYLRGLSLFYRHTREANAAAANKFEEAVQHDATYALAHGWRAWSDVRAVMMEWTDSPEAVLDRAAESARAAIALDGQHYFGRWVLGAIQMTAGHYEQARQEMKQALKARPNDADLLAGLAKVLALLGEPDEGVELGRRARRLNPHGPVWYHWNAGIASYCADHYDEAVDLLSRTARLNREARLYLVASLVRTSRGAEARPHVDAILKKDPVFSVTQSLKSLGSLDPQLRRKLAGDLLDAGLPQETSFECIVRPATCR